MAVLQTYMPIVVKLVDGQEATVGYAKNIGVDLNIARTGLPFYTNATAGLLDLRPLHAGLLAIAALETYWHRNYSLWWLFFRRR